MRTNKNFRRISCTLGLFGVLRGSPCAAVLPDPSVLALAGHKRWEFIAIFTDKRSDLWEEHAAIRPSNNAWWSTCSKTEKVQQHAACLHPRVLLSPRPHMHSANNGLLALGSIRDIADEDQEFGLQIRVQSGLLRLVASEGRATFRTVESPHLLSNPGLLPKFRCRLRHYASANRSQVRCATQKTEPKAMNVSNHTNQPP